jgi:transcriptional regulator with XRE-family HTH domain
MVKKPPALLKIHPLKRWLFENQVTQIEFAERVGIGQGFLSDIMGGRRRPSTETMDAIRKATKGEITADTFGESS